MKNFFKIVGLVIGIMTASLGLFVVGMWIAGEFEPETIEIETLSLEVEGYTPDADGNISIRTLTPIDVKVTYTPADATNLNVTLKDLVSSTSVLEFPANVVAGETFTVTPKKTAAGDNIGGEASLQAIAGHSLSNNKLNVLVDVAVTSDGLMLASDYDQVSADGSTLVSGEVPAGGAPFSFYVFTNPAAALNPVASDAVELEYKNVTLTSENDAITILSGAVEKTGFYNPNYLQEIAGQTVDHNGPFYKADGSANDPVDENGTPRQLYKFLEFEAQAITGGSGIKILASVNKTYDMQDEYVNPNNYNDQNGGTAQYYADLGNYLEKFKDYYNTDERLYNLNTGLQVYEGGDDIISGADLIKVLPTTDNKIIINAETYTTYSAAINFFTFVTVSKSFNVEQIEIDRVVTTLTDQDEISYTYLNGTTTYTLSQFIDTFKISLVPTDSQFDSEDVEARIIDMVITEKHGTELATDENKFFSITNPTSEIKTWKIEPIKEIDPTIDVYFQLHLKTEGVNNVDENHIINIKVNIEVIGIESFTFVTEKINSNMLVKNYASSSINNIQVLTDESYVLTGENGKKPTYTTVRYFIDADTALNAAGNFVFQFWPDGEAAPNVTNLRLPNTTTNLNVFAITNIVNGDTILKSINVSDAPVEIIAAVIKTDLNGNPVYAQGGDGFEAAEFEAVSIAKNNYNSYYGINVDSILENINFYTTYVDDNNITKYKLRDSANNDIVGLIADQNYTIIATPFILGEDGFISATEHPVGGNVNSLVNLNRAMANSLSKIDFSDTSSKIETNQPILITNDVALGYYYYELNIETKAGDITDNNQIVITAQGINDLQGILNPTNLITEIGYVAVEQFVLVDGTDAAVDLGANVTISPEIATIDNNTVIFWSRSGSNAKFDLNYKIVTKINGRQDQFVTSNNFSENSLTSAMQIDWNLVLDSTDTTDNVSNYLSIVNSRLTDDNGISYFKPVVDIKAGGAQVDALATIKIYGAVAAEVAINFDLSEPVITHALKSLVSGTLIDNSSGAANAQPIESGASLDLFRTDLGENIFDIEFDGANIAALCTYTIESDYMTFNGGTKTATVTDNAGVKSLIINANAVSNSVGAIMRITTPFDNSYVYYFYIETSVSFTTPADVPTVVGNNTNTIDLSSYYVVSDGATTVPTSFSIIDGQNYASIQQGGAITGFDNKFNNVTLTANAVHENKVVAFEMKYYVDGQEFSTTTINGKPITIVITPESEIVFNKNMQSSLNTTFKITSGSEYDLTALDISGVDFNNLRFSANKAKLPYSLEDLSEAQGLFDNLDLRVSGNKISSNLIYKNLNVAVDVYFKYGSMEEYVTTIYVTAESGLNFVVDYDNANLEQANDSEAQTKYDAEIKNANGNNIENTKQGSSFAKAFTADADKNVSTGSYEIVLNDFSVTDNVINLTNQDSSLTENPFADLYLGYTLSVFNGSSYVSTIDTSVVLVDKGINNLKLVIKKAVSITTYYKLDILTEIGTQSYYFNLVPHYTLGVNNVYGNNSDTEKVIEGSTVDMLSGLLNPVNRIVMLNKDGSVMANPTNDGSVYTLADGNKLTLASNKLPIRIYSNNPYVQLNGTEVTFMSIPVSSLPVVVYAELFNGVVVEYGFTLYQSLPEITVSNTSLKTHVFAGSSYEIKSTDLTTQNSQANFNYVIKITELGSGLTINNVTGLSADEIGTAIKVGDVFSLNYEADSLTFKVVDGLTSDSSFTYEIWNNYSIDNSKVITQNVTVKPNFDVTANHNGSIAGGIEYELFSKNTTALFELNSLDTTDLSAIEVVVKYGEQVLNPADSSGLTDSEKAVINIFGDAENLNANPIVSFDNVSKKYVLKTKNVSQDYTLTVELTKSFGAVPYTLTYNIIVKPNLVFSSNYTTSSNPLNVTAAAIGQSKNVHLNEQPNAYYVTNLMGEQNTVKPSVSYATEVSENNFVGFTPGAGHPIVGSVPTASNITLTLGMVNTATLIKAIISFDLGDGVIIIKELYILIQPNITNTPENPTGVQYLLGTSIDVLGATSQTLTNSNGVVINDRLPDSASGNNDATITARQSNGAYAGIVFVATDNENYTISNVSGTPTIAFKAFPSSATINVLVYFDLTDSSVKVIEQSEVDNYYKPNLYVSINIISPLNSIEITSNKSAEEAYDLTHNFIDVRVDDNGTEVDNTPDNYNELFVLTGNGSGGVVEDSYNVAVAKYNDNYESNKYNFNEIMLIDAANTSSAYFNIAGLTETNKDSVLSELNWYIIVETQNADLSWSKLPDAQAGDYYVASTLQNEGKFVSIIPAYNDLYNTIRYQITVSLDNGQEVIIPSEAGIQQYMYITMQFSGTYTYKLADGDVTNVRLGNTGKVVQTKTLPASLTALNEVDNYFVVNDYYSFAYHLADLDTLPSSITVPAENPTYDATSKMLYVANGSIFEQYFVFDNVELQVEFSNINNYAELDKTDPLKVTLKPLNWFTANQENVQLNYSVKAGSNATSNAITLNSVVVTYSATSTEVAGTYSFDHSVLNNGTELSGNNDENITDVNIVLMQNYADGSLISDADYALFASWLTKNVNGIYAFVPNLNLVKTDVTLQFNVTSRYRNDFRNSFNDIVEITLVPNVSLQSNLTQKELSTAINQNTFNVFAETTTSEALFVTEVNNGSIPKYELTLVSGDVDSYLSLSGNDGDIELVQGLAQVVTSDVVFTFKDVNIAEAKYITFELKVTHANGNQISQLNHFTILPNIYIDGIKDSYIVPALPETNPSGTILLAESGVSGIAENYKVYVKSPIITGTGIDQAVNGENKPLSFFIELTDITVSDVNVTIAYDVTNYLTQIEKQNPKSTILNGFEFEIYYDANTSDEDKGILYKTVMVNFVP